MDVPFVVNYGLNSLYHVSSIVEAILSRMEPSWHRHNGLTFSRMPREQIVPNWKGRHARIGGCNVLLGGLILTEPYLPPAYETLSSQYHYRSNDGENSKPGLVPDTRGS